MLCIHPLARLNKDKLVRKSMLSYQHHCAFHLTKHIYGGIQNFNMMRIALPKDMGYES